MVFIWQQFHRHCSRYLSLIWLWKLLWLHKELLCSIHASLLQKHTNKSIETCVPCNQFPSHFGPLQTSERPVCHLDYSKHLFISRHRVPQCPVKWQPPSHRWSPEWKIRNLSYNMQQPLPRRAHKSILRNGCELISLFNAFNLLSPGKSGCDFENSIFDFVLLIGIFRFSFESTVRWMPGPYRWYVIIGLGSVLVLSDNKPSPKPMLTSFYVFLRLHWTTMS